MGTQLRWSLGTLTVVSIGFMVFGLVLAPDADSMSGTRWIDRVDTVMIVAWQSSLGAVLAALARLLGDHGDRGNARLLWVAAGAMFTSAVAGGIEDGFRVAVMFVPYLLAVLVAWISQLVAGCRRPGGSVLLGCCLAVPPVAAILFNYLGWVLSTLAAVPLIWRWAHHAEGARTTSARAVPRSNE
ncbi:hypothetical protein I601_2652 [Nocardioides dokdonensis FR1436]|uniref:Uncharacterized protein n=1 Tax=Nocardioides dokdonensis FR1436 TaxID=1300347 RepID=A0A1A9GLA9_9ACTN|nr:hypothetical protein I601_2652 [Nocardioides dokdonensis FR1436]